MSITEFINARIDEKEAGATSHHRLLCMRTACDADDCIWPSGEREAMERERVCTCGYPNRVLAECEAMRKIVEEVSAWKPLAAIWSDHADYEEGWR